MNIDPTALERLRPLIDAALSGTVTPQQADELESLLKNDREACKVYCEYASIEAEMHLLTRARKVSRNASGQISASPNLDDIGSAYRSAAIAPPLPVPGILTTAIPGTISYFSSGWPVAYLVATVVLGIGLLIGASSYVSTPVQVVQQPDASPSPLSPLHSFVGRITGMVDCQWADDSTAAFNSAHVPLGRKYALASGLLEITYDSGAKVILQGPATYEVESSAGGFLSVGKLTARVEKKEERGTKNEELSGSRSSFLIPHSYFAVHTPTATVTDLGTEFGVEVATNGACEVHVIQGLVQADFHGSIGQDSRSVQLKAGEASRYEPAINEATAIPADRAKFAEMRIIRPSDRRQRWLAYSQQLRKDPALVAYYTFEKVENGNTRALPNLSSAGKALDGQIEGCDWVYGRLPGKYALLFRGPDSDDKVILPDQERFNFKGPFSIAVWFKVLQFRGEHAALVAKGNQSWRFQQSSERNELKFDTNYGPTLEHGTLGRVEVTDHRWHLGVVVYEPVGTTARKRLYIDDHLDAEDESPLSLNRTDDPVCLGSHGNGSRTVFQGWIDEVAIFERALSAKEVQQMFDAGNPAGLPRGKADKSK